MSSPVNGSRKQTALWGIQQWTLAQTQEIIGKLAGMKMGTHPVLPLGFLHEKPAETLACLHNPLREHAEQFCLKKKK